MYVDGLQSCEEVAGTDDKTECGESASDEWFEWTDIDGDEESYTESGPDVVLSIIRSWNTWVVINWPLSAAGDVEISLLLYPDELKDDDTSIRVFVLLFCTAGAIVFEVLLKFPEKIIYKIFNTFI